MPLASHTSRRRLLQASAVGLAFGQLGLPAHAQIAEAPPLDSYRPEFLSPAEWAFIKAATARLIPSDGEGPGAIETRVPVFIDLQLAGDFGAAADWYMEGPFDPAADPLLGYQSPLPPAEIYRQGIDVFDRWCRDRYGSVFAELPPDRQDEALAALEENAGPATSTPVGGDESGDLGAVEGAPDARANSGAPWTGGEARANEAEPAAILRPELRDFFRLLLQNTKEGYFADPRYGGNAGMQAWVYIGFPGARASYSEWATRHNERYPLGPVSIAGERA
jgi:gluconate 2-dehydrogenase gamma chain